MAAYTQASDAVFAVFHDTSPLVEPISVDEAFIDVAGLLRVSGTPVQIAARLRSEVRDRIGLPITVGIARTKFPRQGRQPGGQTRWPGCWFRLGESLRSCIRCRCADCGAWAR